MSLQSVTLEHVDTMSPGIISKSTKEILLGGVEGLFFFF